jgi:hypothetical protein
MTVIPLVEAAICTAAVHPRPGIHATRRILRRPVMCPFDASVGRTWRSMQLQSCEVATALFAKFLNAKERLLFEKDDRPALFDPASGT